MAENVTIGAQRGATSGAGRTRFNGGLSTRNQAVQTASRVVLSVVKQACDLLNTMRTNAAQCEDTRTVVNILNDAEMAYKKPANTWRAGIAVADVQGEACRAFGDALPT